MDSLLSWVCLGLALIAGASIATACYLQTRVEALSEIVNSLAARVFDQSDLLSKKAERKP